MELIVNLIFPLFPMSMTHLGGGKTGVGGLGLGGGGAFSPGCVNVVSCKHTSWFRCTRIPEHWWLAVEASWAALLTAALICLVCTAGSRISVA